MGTTELSKDKYILVNGNKFKLLFKNEEVEIVEVKIKRRDGSGKWNTFYYADLGMRDYEDGYKALPYKVDFYSKSELKNFIRRMGVEKEFSKSFIKAA